MANWLTSKLPFSSPPLMFVIFAFLFAAGPFFYVFIAHKSTLVDFELNVPKWFYFLQAFCFLVYKLFIGIASKQAKRHGSPLAVWLEGSCGILVLGMNCMVAAKCADIGDGWDGIIPIVAVLSECYFGQLEAYYTGKNMQPWLNGTSDGSFLMILAFVVLGIIGDGILEVPVANHGLPEEVDIKDMLSLAIILGQIFSIVRHIRTIYESGVGEEDPEVRNLEVVTPILLVQTVGYFSCVASILLLPMMGKMPMIDYPAPDGQDSHLFPVLMLVLMFNAFISQVLLLNRLARQHFNPLEYKMVKFLVISLFIVYLIQAIDKSIKAKHIAIMTWVVLDLFIIFWLQFIVSAIMDLAGALHINLDA